MLTYLCTFGTHHFIHILFELCTFDFLKFLFIYSSDSVHSVVLCRRREVENENKSSRKLQTKK